MSNHPTALPEDPEDDADDDDMEPVGDPGNYDGGFGEDSYYAHEMAKDD